MVATGSGLAPRHNVDDGIMIAAFAFGSYLAESDPDDPNVADIFARVEVLPTVLRFFAKADDPNTKWITLKPSGADSKAYVHVKIRVNPSSGHATVVSGNKELRGLKLTRLASNEELKQRAKDRQVKKKAKKEEDAKAEKEKAQKDLERSASDPEFAQKHAREKLAKTAEDKERAAKVDEYRKQVEELTGEVAKRAGAITGDEGYSSAAMDNDSKTAYTNALREHAAQAWLRDNEIDPESVNDEALKSELAAVKGGGAVVASRNLRQVHSAIDQLERNIVQDLVKDESLAQAVLQGSGDVDRGVLEPKGKTKSTGYKRDSKNQAAEQGYTPDDAGREKEDVRQQQLAEMSPDQAAAREHQREFTRKMAAAATELSGTDVRTEKPDTEVSSSEITEKAEHVRSFLEAQQKLRQAKRELRRLELGKDPAATPEERDALDEGDVLPEGADLGVDISEPDEAFVKELQKQIGDAAGEALTMQFLDSVEQGDDGEPATPEVGAALRNHMHAAVGAGSHAHLANTALSLTGAEGLDRQVIDTLGLEAASQLTAHMLRRDLTPNDLEDAKTGLAGYHDEVSLSKMQSAMEDADAARAEAAQIKIPPINGTVDAALVGDLMREKKERLDEARDTLGAALGAVEAGAALNLALKGGAKGGLNVDFAKRDTAQVATALRALGLGDGHYTLKRDAQTSILSAKITPEGMDALTPKLDSEKQKLFREVQAIKDGADDEADWLPAGFVNRPATSFEQGERAPGLAAAAPDFSGGVEQGLRDYAGSLYAEGMSPMQIYREVTSVGFDQHVQQGQRAEFDNAVKSLLPAQKLVQKPTKELRDEITARLKEALGRTPREDEIKPRLQQEVDSIGSSEAGSTGPRKTYDEMQGVDLDQHDGVKSALAKQAEGYLNKFYPGETGFHAQRLDDAGATKEALFRALAENPGLQAAYADPEKMGGDSAGRAQAKAVREHYLKNVLQPTLRGATIEQDVAQRKGEYEGAKKDIDTRYTRLGGGKLPGKFMSNASAQQGIMSAFGGDEDSGEVTLKFKVDATPEQKRLALSELGLSVGHYKETAEGVALTDSGKEALDLRKAARRFSKQQTQGKVGEEQRHLESLNGKLEDLKAEKERHVEEGGDPEEFPANRELDDLKEQVQDQTQVQAEAHTRATEENTDSDEEEPGAGDLSIITGGLDKINPQYLQMTAEHDRVDRKYAYGGGRWAELVMHAGGPNRAYSAVQEHMKGVLASSLHEHYGAASGKGLRLSKLTTQHHRSILRATDEDALKALRTRDRELDTKNRERQGGKFSYQGGQGSVSKMRDQSLSQEGMDKMAGQSALFGMTPPQPEPGLFGGGEPSLFDAPSPGLFGGETQVRKPKELKLEADERLTLGHGVESQVKTMLDGTNFGIRPGENPTSMIKDVTWGAGSDHVGKQRFVKALEKSKKFDLLAGVGSGKTATMLGAFTHLHDKGNVKKALIAAPSAVRNQFGSEVLRFTEPGKYGFHAHDDSFEGRMRALTDKDTHFVVTTHQTMRDDMIKLAAAHAGEKPEAMSEKFAAMGEPERDALLGGALQKRGIDPKDLLLCVDEGHGFLDRQGKEDSLLSNVGWSLKRLAGYGVHATGSPIKNDISEAFSWLHGNDPERFSDRDAFMRRYGVDTEASREAFQRVMGQYSMVDAVPSGVKRNETWGAADESGDHKPIPLSAEQRGALEGVHKASTRASRAHRDGRVDVEALKTLSPNSFAGVPEAEHAALAGRLGQALGTLKHAATGRVVNQHPAESNAKVQHALKLADGYRKAGKAGVIFADHHGSVNILKKALTTAGHKVGVVDGSMDANGKADMKAKFDRGEVSVVIGTSAAEAGLNLQKTGRYVVHYDLPATKKSVEQRSARVDRLGQTDDVDVHYLQTDAKVDSDARRRIERKGRLGSALQGRYESMDDVGLAKHLNMAREERANGGYLAGDLKEAA